MFYYKIPIIDGVFDYPAGCVLCCAYPVDNYMYCKFESVTSVGSSWVEITESEFDVRCPDFPAPDPSPVQETIASSATLSGGSIMLTLPAPVDTGTLVKFMAPCACESVTGGIVIDGVTYSVVDAAGNTVDKIGGAWIDDVMVAVLIDVENKKAYIQNASLISLVEDVKDTANAALPKSGGTMTGTLMMNGGHIVLKEGVNYGTSLPKPGIKGRVFFKVVG